MSGRIGVITEVSEIEYNLYRSTVPDFTNLPWCQKIALKRVCDAGSFASAELRRKLSDDGFADPDKIIGNLITKGFLHGAMGMLRPQASKVKWLEVWFGKTKLC